MLHSSKLVFAAALVGGAMTLSTVSQAESSKEKSAVTEKKSQASGDDFEENRKLHMQKSKENNDKKGAN